MPMTSSPAVRRWLVLTYRPTALFSLKLSAATSSVGTSLLLPTPYAIKMGLVDAAFRAGLAERDCADLLCSLREIPVHIKLTGRAVVTHTFVKVRQESRGDDPLRPYSSSIAYREMVFHEGDFQWAFGLSANDAALAARMLELGPMVNYIGKRGGFIRYLGDHWREELDATFTQPLDGGTWHLPDRCHIRPLDDFGSEATLEHLSSFSQKKAKWELHRVFVRTVIPLGLVNTGPGFSLYET